MTFIRSLMPTPALEPALMANTLGLYHLLVAFVTCLVKRATQQRLIALPVRLDTFL